MMADQAHRLSVAPMMDWTDRHCRMFHRQISGRAQLYTEMVTSAALVRGGAWRLLAHDPAEHPLVLQLGGSDPAELAEAARIGAAQGYDEINLNVGCPSDRVQSGCFGAVLMKRPDLVADCVAAMRAASGAEITVKCRIGVDDDDPRVALPGFLETVAAAGVRHFVIHARKAWLAGLSPRENREIPPLEHDLVAQMLRDFPALRLSLNGGIGTLEEARRWLGRGFHGVMIGRAAYHTPHDVLAGADAAIWGMHTPVPDRAEVVARMRPHIDRHLAAGGRLHAITRHMLGLFAGQPGARAWRRLLSEGATRPGAGPELLDAALAEVRPKAA
ncbi:tRNA dihydrouridine(20/20a) synthase DusA [Rhodobaculum claviforme]|uniref:tRNA-dihydrouridine(20/20a) synthase n=1 Tax=Rhodobaculum claviforme TaxID=1549854 RepID=A0A934TKB4_9RHOB|nr:tRNA dihydrouridine(20/20a) synthase DusA [Rhodobaculum claviforme]MBK5926628.1 tRNA dihydrouridine(20/20a) synthase DusA [Rhodobaculum claviforme]